MGDIFPVTIELKLVGIFENPDGAELLYFSREYLRELIPNSDAVGQLVVQAESPEAVAGVAKAIDALFENSPASTKTESEQAFQLSFIAFLGNVTSRARGVLSKSLRTRPQRPSARRKSGVAGTNQTA